MLDKYRSVRDVRRDQQDGGNLTSKSIKIRYLTYLHYIKILHTNYYTINSVGLRAF